MREFFTIAIFKIKADIRMNKTTLNSQKEKHSLLSLRRATFVGLAAHRLRNISIHALLAESDVVAVVVILSTGKFLSTLSLRRATGNPARRPIGRRHFYPRSPCGERRCQADKICKPVVISIHALLAESDRPLSALYSVNRYFYPRSPCGERQTVFVSTTGFSLFLSTLSLRRATCCRLGHTWPSAYFYPRSPCGERLPETAEVVPSRQFLSTLSLRRATR